MTQQRKGILLLISQILFVAYLGGQIDSIADQRAVVVKVRVIRPGQPDETAAGIFVGKDQKNAYFLTAYHAIKPRKNGISLPVSDDCGDSSPKSEFNDPTPSVELQFSETPRAAKAEVLSSFDPDLDLGVVSAPVENLAADISIISAKDAAPDILIHIIGHPPAGNWSVLPGTISNENAPNGDVHRFVTSGPVAAGYSGGPVLDSKGNLYGMHVCSTATYGKAVKISEILALLRAWRVPINNLSLSKSNLSPPDLLPKQESLPAPTVESRYGSLAVSSDRGGAISMDGTAYGEVQPFAVMNFPKVLAGPHTVRVKKSGYRDTEDQVMVSPGQKAVVELKQIALPRTQQPPTLSAQDAALTPEAKKERGDKYHYGRGVEQDNQKAREWYERAAADGNTEAMRLLSRMYEVAEGGPEDHQQAARWAEKAAVAGDAEGMFSIGYYYESGLGVARDYMKARQWYQKCAAAGNTLCMEFLGGVYEAGEGVPPDHQSARQWYEKAAAGGAAGAMYKLGRLYEEGGTNQDYPRARQWYEKAAKAGIHEAMYKLGRLYEEGQSGPQDYKLAQQWYEKAAEAGNRDAMRSLGWMYDIGRVTQDDQQARHWYERAAVAGDPRAMYYFGYFYEMGRGGPKDYDQARQWYEKAKIAGVPDAKTRLDGLPR